MAGRAEGERDEREDAYVGRSEVLRNPPCWPVGWAGFEGLSGAGESLESTEEIAEKFDDELAREIARGHPLFGRRCIAIAKREGADDVLFAVGPEEVAVAHLTWSGKPERPPWPRSTLYTSFDAFLASTAGDFGY